MGTNVVPFQDSDLAKKEQVEKMFDDIAVKYDFLNRFLSLGIDKIWRKKSINLLKSKSPKVLLDVATGTGDFAIDAYKILSPDKINGIDISQKMLEVGKEKMQKLGLEKTIFLNQEDSEKLSFASNTFDACTCAFGVRNFEHLEIGLGEMYRVLKPNGSVLILEFSNPTKFPFKQLFGFYFRYILPSIGNWISKSKSAYTYLPESVKVFPQGEEMKKILEKIGFKKVICKELTLGIVSIYLAEK